LNILTHRSANGWQEAAAFLLVLNLLPGVAQTF
jgi:hypothetical protein